MSTYAVDREKWQKQSIFYQMGNIGSEVGRTFKASRLGDKQMQESAKKRAEDLFDATIHESPKVDSYRRREIENSKQEFLKAIDNPSSQPAVENYFMQFAVAYNLTKR